MRVLFLGPGDCALPEFIRAGGDEVDICDLPLTGRVVDNADFLVSYRYRHIVDAEVVARFDRRIINLHISLLPWNRGADPNLWSFLMDTPKGVSIHYIDEGIDTGDLLAQEEVTFSVENTTLRTSYNSLCDRIEGLFVSVWPEVRICKRAAASQGLGGSYHRASEAPAFRDLLTDGWDTPVSGLIGRGREEG